MRSLPLSPVAILLAEHASIGGEGAVCPPPTVCPNRSSFLRGTVPAGKKAVSTPYFQHPTPRSQKLSTTAQRRGRPAPPRRDQPKVQRTLSRGFLLRVSVSPALGCRILGRRCGSLRARSLGIMVARPSLPRNRPAAWESLAICCAWKVVRKHDLADAAGYGPSAFLVPLEKAPGPQRGLFFDGTMGRQSFILRRSPEPLSLRIPNFEVSNDHRTRKVHYVP